MNDTDKLRMRAQVAIAAFVLLVMVVFIVAGVEYPQAFAIFTWAINGELFLEGGAKWGGKAIKRMTRGDD
jgi:hypothetical protein